MKDHIMADPSWSVPFICYNNSIYDHNFMFGFAVTSIT